MNYKIIVTIFTLLFLSNLIAQEEIDYDKVLCGEKPTTDAEKKIQKKSLNHIKDNMPPIRHQNPSGWCYAFQASDIIDYHNFKNQTGKLSKDDFYVPANMTSPIDLISIEKRWLNSRDISPSTTPMKIDTRIGGNTGYIFTGIQEQYFARSFSQVPFSSLKDNNPEAVALVKNLIAEYKKKNKKEELEYYTIAGERCPSSCYKSDDFQEKISSFFLINNHLYNKAKQEKLLPSPYTIEDYERLATMHYGPPKIKIQPFTQGNASYQNATRYLQQVAKIIDKGNGSPLKISVCGDDFMNLPPSYTPLAECGEHAMSVTGIGYENGKCKVKLRNSWGKDWGEEGYLTISARDFALSQMLYLLYNPSSGYNLDWIEKVTNQAPLKNRHKQIKIVKENTMVIGERIIQFNGPKSTTTWKHYKEFKNDQLIEVDSLKASNGLFFTGKVDDLENGKWKEKSGLYKKDGKIVKAIKYKLKDRTRFTGTIIDNGGGGFSTDTGIFYANNKIYRAKDVLMKNGFTFTGNTKDLGNDKWEPTRGSYYKNGKLVKLLRFQSSKGGIYTGTVDPQNNGTFFYKTGTMTFPDGSKEKFIDGNIQ